MRQLFRYNKVNVSEGSLLSMRRVCCPGLPSRSSSEIRPLAVHTQRRFLQSTPESSTSVNNDRQNRPMTIRERIIAFPYGVKQLYLDCLLYKNIHDASRTKLNAWTLNHPFLDKKKPSSSDGEPSNSNEKKRKGSRPFYMIYQNELRPGRIPRRQHEQQRRMAADLSMVLPLVILWMPPIIGYLPLVLAVAAPRQVLSRQFLNEYEIHYFSELEYQQRKRCFPLVSKLFWNATTRNGEPLKFPILGTDAAGPIIDPFQLFVADSHEPLAPVSNPFRHFLASLKVMPREYLVYTALSVGVHQNFPPVMARFLTQWCTPHCWLYFRIQQIARVVSDDDALLLEEEAGSTICSNLTDLEVMDACLMRGLPVLKNVADMRECLTNHLVMIASVKERLMPAKRSEEFNLLCLHLPIFRATLPNSAT